MKNKGVSLIVLIITIIVMLILTSVITLQIFNNIGSAKIASFVENISTIQEYVDSRLILNEQLPFLNNKYYLVDELVNNGYLLEKKHDAFKNELINNGDREDTKFYIIDINNIEGISSTIGNGKNGNNDYFVVSEDTNRVYYLLGIDVGKDTYFSLSDKITDVYKIKNKSDLTSKTKVQMYSGVKVNRDYSNYTNKMGINIQANLKDDEDLFITIGESKVKFVKNTNLLNISFNNIDELNQITVSNFDKLSLASLEDRYLTITKENNEKIISSYKIDLSNYDIDAPVVEDLSSIEYDSMKVVSGNCLDNDGKVNSGINNIRYEFLTNTNGKPYYDDNVEYNIDYMLEEAKIAKCDEDGRFSIRIPKDVLKLRIICIDNAENISEMLDFTV